MWFCCPAAISRPNETRCWGLAAADASAELIARLAGPTSDRRFASAHDVMLALGINDPEHRAHC